MSVIYVVLPVALLLAGAAVVAFAWAVRSGQLDDLETPAWRMLVEEDGGGDAVAVAGAGTDADADADAVSDADADADADAETLHGHDRSRTRRSS